MRARISANLLKTLKPQEKTYEVRDDKMTGFILRVHPTGRMTYLIEYGRGKKHKVGTTDKLKPVKARKAARTKLAGAQLGQDPSKERKAARAYTLADYLERVYRPWARAHMKTGDRQVNRIKSAFADLLTRKLGEVTLWLIEKHRSQRIKAGRTVATVNKDVGALRAALRRAVDWGILETHPLGKVKALREDTAGRIRFLTATEEGALRKALDTRQEKHRKNRDSANAWRRQRGYQELPDLRARAFTDRLAPLVLLALNTGLRRGELFNVKWADIDLEGRLLTVEGRGAKTTKTRYIPLNEEAWETLSGWRAQTDGERVFPADDGGRLDNINKAWDNVLTAAKISDFRFHDLRHTFASNLVMAGVDLYTVSQLLGHSDLAMTQRYSHLSPEAKRQAVERLDSRTIPVPTEAEGVVNG